MTETKARYKAIATDGKLIADEMVVLEFADSVAIPADALQDYFNRRREALIQELRALDRYLGRAQTIPER